MSDFKVIKCKKCDAPLVELLGEKITQCNQCGYKFSMHNSSNVNSGQSSTNDKFRTATQMNDSPATPELNQLIRKLKQKVAQQTNKGASVNLSTKNKSWVFIMFKWYFIIAIIAGILMSIFSD